MTFWNKFYFVFSRISIHALKHDDDDGVGDAGVTNSYYFQPQVMKANTETSNPQTESGHGFPPEKGMFIGLWLEKCGDHWKQFYQFIIIVDHKFLISEASCIC